MCKNYQHEGSICNHLWPLGVPGHLCLVDSEKWALLHVSTRTKPIMVIHGLYFAIPERRQEYWDICIRVHCCIGLHGKGTSNWGPKNGQLRSWNCVSKTSRSSLPRTKMRWRFGGGPQLVGLHMLTWKHWQNMGFSVFKTHIRCLLKRGSPWSTQVGK